MNKAVEDNSVTRSALHSVPHFDVQQNNMKKIIYILLAVAVTTLTATAEKELNEVDAIVEAYRTGETEKATKMLKELSPDSYRAIQDLIKRVLEQEKKVESARRQLEVQKQFLDALSTRLSKEVEQIFEAHPQTGG